MLAASMPLIRSQYRPPTTLKQSDLNTIYAGTLRSRIRLAWRRERLELADGDFVDLDWVDRPRSKRLAILTHGLEGHARRPYVAGTARALRRCGFAVCAMNFRGCSGEPNRHLRSYHIGETGDLRQVIDHALDVTQAKYVFLAGYSLGGSVLLKYLSGDAALIPPQVMGASVFPVPLYVAECAGVINTVRNWAYRWSFIINMNRKARRKVEERPDLGPFKRAKSFDEFDEWYTAPWHGFESAQEYWSKCSSGPTLAQLKRPALVVNAADDSFLHESCYPTELAQQLDQFYLEIPDHGGHCGFVERNANGDYYSDRRAAAFAQALLEGEEGLARFLSENLQASSLSPPA